MKNRPIWLAVVLCITAVPCAGRKERAPLRPQILAAKTVHVENHGSARLKDRAYDELKKWGRWAIVEDRAMAGQQPCVSFQQPITLSAGSTPWTVAVGDFDGDAIPDLVTANRDSNDISVFLGNGDGTFQQAMTFPSSGTGVQSVAVGDFNGDGVQDLAVANQDTDNVSIFLGNGDGTFTEVQGSPFSAGSNPRQIAVGDFNGDGVEDLAVANFFGPVGTVSILLGNGDGTFQAETSFNAGDSPFHVVVGAFNAESAQYLAVPNVGADDVSILEGFGDGSFGEATNFVANDGPRFIAVGDFDGDGALDLAVATYRGDVAGDVSVLLGNGDGTFQRATHWFAGQLVQAVVVADFDGDGKQDIAAANFGVVNNLANVWVLCGDGDGTFQPAANFPVREIQRSIATADFNLDGKPDLVVVHPIEPPNNVSVLLNNTPARPR